MSLPLPAPTPRRRWPPPLAGVLLVALLLACVLLAWPALSRRLAREGVLHAGDVLLQPGDVRLDEAAARELFAPLREPDGRFAWDPVGWLVLKPHHELVWPWPEHPAGRVVLATNGRGLREDEETLVPRQGPRVLVLGDSHAEGLVDNRESFANLLQERLARPDRPVDVVNAAVGGSGPHNALALLRLHADLSPDVVVLAFYAGNDFLGALLFSDAFTGRPVRERSPAYFDRMREAEARWRTILPQSFNQAALFRERPGDDEVAYRAAHAAVLALAEACARLPAPLLVLLLPSKPDVDGDDAATTAQVLATLQLDEDDLATGLRLGQRLLGELSARGVAVLDPTAAMRGAAQPLYWRGDHHLSVAGHARVAELLAPAVEALLPER